MTKAVHLFLGLALVCLSTSCLTYQEVEVAGVENVNVKEFSKDGISAEVSLRVKNPNKYKITIADTDLNLSVNGTSTGKADIEEKMVLPRKSDQVHQVTVSADYKNLLTGGIGALFSLLGSKSMKLRIQGTVTAKALFIKKTFPIDVTERVEM